MSSKPTQVEHKPIQTPNPFRKPISLTFDTYNNQYAVLLEDGTIWVRKYVRHGNSVEPDGWEWEQMEINIK